MIGRSLKCAAERDQRFVAKRTANELHPDRLSFLKIRSGRIRAVMENQTIRPVALQANQPACSFRNCSIMVCR